MKTRFSNLFFRLTVSDVTDYWKVWNHAHFLLIIINWPDDSIHILRIPVFLHKSFSGFLGMSGVDDHSIVIKVLLVNGESRSVKLVDNTEVTVSE